MPSISAGSTATFSVSGKQSVVITSSSNSIGTVTRTQYVEGPTSNTDQFGPPAMNVTYGPYGSIVDFTVTCTYGQIDYEVDGDAAVFSSFDPATGRITISAANGPVSSGDLEEPHICSAISYVGDGLNKNLDFGFEPDAVLVKGDGKAAVFFTREQWLSNVQSFGHTTYSGSDSASSAPSINKDGVALCYFAGAGAAARDSYNRDGVAYHAVAIRDNGANFLRSLAYNGYTTSVGGGSVAVTMDALDGDAPKWVHIKRDATGAGHEGVWISDDGYVKKESAAAVNTALATYVAGGALNLSTDAAVNENDGGIVGEGHNVFALIENADCWGQSSYVGGAGATLSFSRKIALAIILPVAAEEMVFSTATMGKGATGGATALFDGISLSSNRLTIAASATSANTAGVTYRVIAIYAGAAREKRDKWPTAHGVLLQNGAGRIVCGTDASLQITGAHSLEWVGAIADENGEQFLFGRMNGGRSTPSAGTYNFALSHTRDPDAGIEICTSDQYSAEAASASKQKRWRTGVVLTPFELYHIVYTHDGTDKWCLYINGKLVKWRRLAMSIFSMNGITGTAGLTTAFGGRLSGGSYYANTATVHKFARIYNRVLTAAEVKQMYRRNALQQLVTSKTETDLSDIATSLIEEWKFRNGSGTTVTATKVGGNNGTITSGGWIR